LIKICTSTETGQIWGGKNDRERQGVGGRAREKGKAAHKKTE
jgi:hypothetical protein